MQNMHVAKIIDEYTLVINKGSKDGITQSNIFLIYEIGKDPIIDPITKENLGELEILKGRAKVSHLQENICTVAAFTKSEPKKIKISTQRPAMAFFSEREEEEIIPGEIIPFNHPKVGDLAKIIK